MAKFAIIILFSFFSLSCILAQSLVPMPEWKPRPLINLSIFQAATVSDPTLIGRWQYPNGMITSNFYWDLQSTTNFITWTTEQTNLGPGDVFVRITNKFKFYRMKGR